MYGERGNTLREFPPVTPAEQGHQAQLLRGSMPAWLPQRSELLTPLLLDKWLLKVIPVQKWSCYSLQGRRRQCSERLHTLSTHRHTAAAEDMGLSTPQPNPAFLQKSLWPFNFLYYTPQLVCTVGLVTALALCSLKQCRQAGLACCLAEVHPIRQHVTLPSPSF